MSVGLAVCALVLVAATQLRRVDGLMPYPQHVDERPVLNAAAHVLQSADWNPHLYQYPALPIYMAAAGLAIGVITGSGAGPALLDTQHIGRLAGAYYEHPQLVYPVRFAWAIMAVVTLAAVAGLGFELMGGAGLLLTLAIALAGTHLRELASLYVSVDTPQAMFTALCMWQLSATLERRTPIDRVLIPGVLCGAAMACKYNALVLAVPCLVSIVCFSRGQRVRWAFGFMGVALASFMAFCPYFLLDLRDYVDGIAGVAYHYGVLGHRRFQVAPGWPHFALLVNDMLDEYGWALVLAALLGMLSGIHWRKRLLVASLPVATLLLLSRYKVHFERNELSIIAFIPVLAANGMLVVGRGIRSFALRSSMRWQRIQARPLSLALAGGFAIAVVATLPVRHILDSYADRPDSRVAFARWAKQHLPPHALLLVSRSMPLDVSALERFLEVRRVDLASAKNTAHSAGGGGYFVLPHWKQTGRAVNAVAALEPGLSVLHARTLLQTFDGRPVSPTDNPDIQCVNPGFDVVRIEPTTP